MTLSRTVRLLFRQSLCLIGAYGFFYLCATAFVAFSLGVPLCDYIPTGSDYLLYWKQVQNLRQCLAHTGYFGHEEALSLVNRLGIDGPGASHGLAINLFYSALSLPGWEYATPLRLNFLLSALGLCLYYGLSRNGWKTNCMVFLAVGVVYPLHYFNAYNSFQSVHVLFVCLTAGLIVRMLTKNDSGFGNKEFLALLFVIATGALLRKNWALLLVPASLFLHLSGRRKWLALSLAVVGVLEPISKVPS